jgi:hypothetical protein
MGAGRRDPAGPRRAGRRLRVALSGKETATRLVGCHGFGAAGVERAPQGTGYGAWALVPTLRGTAEPGKLLVSASTLTSAPGTAAPGIAVDGAEVEVSWADGARTNCTWTAAAPEVTTAG